jgi:hypothetical protein
VGKYGFVEDIMLIELWMLPARPSRCLALFIGEFYNVLNVINVFVHVSGLF